MIEIYNEKTSQWEEVVSLRIRYKGAEFSVKSERNSISINKTSWSKIDDGSIVILPVSGNRVLIK